MLELLLPAVLSCRSGSWKLLRALFWLLPMLRGAATVREVSDASTCTPTPHTTAASKHECL
jgi:hypothetical protein